MRNLVLMLAVIFSLSTFGFAEENTKKSTKTKKDNQEAGFVAYGHSPTWSSNGSRLAFIAGNNIVLINMDGTVASKVTSAYKAWGPSYQPETNRIYFQDDLDGDHWVNWISDDGSAARTHVQRIPVSEKYSSPSFSPDGTQYVYLHESMYDGPATLEIANVEDGSIRTILTCNPQLDRMGPAAWGKGINSSRIAYTKTINGTTSIYTINADGTDESRVVAESLGSVERGPISWTPDGKSLLIVHKKAILKVSVATGKAERLTKISRNYFSPVYSPDGITIAYTSIQDGIASIHLLTDSTQKLYGSSSGVVSSKWKPSSTQDKTGGSIGTSASLPVRLPAEAPADKPLPGVQAGMGTSSSAGTAVTVTATSGTVAAALNPLARKTAYYSLVVKVNGAGKVNSSPYDDIKCNGVCAQSFPADSLVVLTGTPEKGNVLADWKGACSGSDICAVKLDSDKEVTATFADNVLLISKGNNPKGVVNKYYALNLTVAGGKEPYTWSLGEGSTLPPGLIFNPETGVISGKPTAVGNYYLKVQVGDSRGNRTEKELPLQFFTGPNLVNYQVPTDIRERHRFIFQDKSIHFKDTLTDLQIVLLVDRSGSQGAKDRYPFENLPVPSGMNKHGLWTQWDNTFLMVNYLAETIFRHDKDKQVHTIFFGSKVDESVVTDHQELLEEFDKCSPSGSTNLLDAVKLAFEKYIPNDISQKTLFIVLTDGMPNPEKTKPFINELIREKISRVDLQGKRLKILFIRSGDDRGAKEWLRKLDREEDFSRNIDLRADDMILKMGPENLILNVFHEHLEAKNSKAEEEKVQPETKQSKQK
jgi:Tol biopolymer transport system component